MISGQILLHGAPLTQTVTLILEDQAYQVIQDMTVSNGEFRFEKLQASSEGYNVLFAQEENPQFGVEEVASWAWIGPIPVQDGDAIRLADMEIGLPGLQQIYPPLDTFLNSGPITPQNPLVFEWTPYPKASHYWLDLRSGSTLQLVWQTDFLDTNNTSFNGILANGETIQPGNYWWNVSARVEDSVMTVSGPLRSFFLNP